MKVKQNVQVEVEVSNQDIARALGLPPSVRIGYHFSKGKLSHGDGDPIVEGKTHTVVPPVKVCGNGLHASPYPHQAWSYVQGCVLAKVLVTGAKTQGDKFAGSSRTYLKVVKLTGSQYRKLGTLFGGRFGGANQAFDAYARKLLGE